MKSSESILGDLNDWLAIIPFAGSLSRLARLWRPTHDILTMVVKSTGTKE